MDNELLNKILFLKEEANKPPIALWKIDKSLDNIERVFSNKNELFSNLCSLNLLNAAIKMSYFRNMITYKQIKEGVSKMLILLASSEQQKKYDVSVYIDPKKIAYVKHFSLQFSFHSIPMNDILHKYMNSSRNNEVEWEGIALQMIAEKLFDLANENESLVIS